MLALSRRPVETNTVYDLPAAKSIEQRLAVWADALLAETRVSGQADAMRP